MNPTFGGGTCHLASSQENMAWRIGNDANVRFWTDKWVPRVGPFLKYASQPLDNAAKEKRALEFLTSSGAWNVSCFAPLLPRDTTFRHSATHLPPTSRVEDEVTWEGTSDKTFYVASAYVVVIGGIANPSLPIYNLVWRWKSPEKFIFFPMANREGCVFD